MAYPLLISRRALLSRENRLLINLTTWIAVLGVGLGVAALVVVNAVYDGYIAEIRGRFVSVLAHLDMAARFSQDGGMRGDEEFLDFLERQSGILAASPSIRRQAMLIPQGALNSRRAGAFLFGIDLERTRRVTSLLETSIEGTANPGPGGIVLGRALAEKLGVGIGDVVIALTDLDLSEQRPSVSHASLTVEGIFRSGFYQFDQTLAYTSLDQAREMFDVPPGVVDHIEMRLEDPQRADEVRAELHQTLGNVRIETWREKYGPFFAGVELTRILLLVILLLLVSVASSNVIGTLIMLAHDRTRDIGILRAMGATRGAMMRVFLLCGIFIGGLGIAVGIGIGLLVCKALTTWDFISIPESVYFIDHVPVVIDWAKVGLMAAVTLLICLVASAAPALRAARLDPVEALRFE